MGVQKHIEFSMAIYLDAYQGHFDTLKYIFENHEHLFHVMMSDIYKQVR